jgi:hypothetical protein
MGAGSMSMGGEKMCAMGSGEEVGSDKTGKRTADNVYNEGNEVVESFVD